MTNSPAYWAPGVLPADAKGHPIFAEIQHAGPWQYQSHPDGGTLATYHGVPGNLDHLAPAREVTDGLRYHAPLVIPHIYDCVKAGSAGVDLTLACGITISIIEATLIHRQMRIGRGAVGLGDPVTEYGRLACRLLEKAKKDGGIPNDSPDLTRLIELAVSQRYRVTSELLDDMGIIAADDIDPILACAWMGDPKALAPATDGAPNASPISGSTGAP